MIKRTVSAIIAILIAFLLQTTLFQVLALADVVPNLLLVITISYGYLRGRTHGMWIGLVSGLMLDMMYGSVIGLYAFIFMTIGFLNGYIRKIFFTDHLILPIVLISVGDFAYEMYYYVTEFLLRGRLHFGFYFVHQMIPEILYTVLIGVLVFRAISKVEDVFLLTKTIEE